MLLVEADRDRNEMFAHALRVAGFRVTQARDAGEAWREVQSRLPHLMVMDVAVPGTAAADLCRRMRSAERTAHVPVIAVTGPAAPALDPAPFDALVTGPWRSETLLDEICRVLERSTEQRVRRVAPHGHAGTFREHRPAPFAGRATQERDDASDIRRRIRADYREMPGLRVTVRQGARLWNVPPALCERLLDDLVREQELVRSGEHYRLP